MSFLKRNSVNLYALLNNLVLFESTLTKIPMQEGNFFKIEMLFILTLQFSYIPLLYSSLYSSYIPLLLDTRARKKKATL